MSKISMLNHHNTSKINVFKKDTCALVNKPTIFETIHTFKNMPALCVCVDSPQSDDLTINTSIALSKPHGVIQLSHLLPLDFNYSLSHNSGIIGKIWSEHHKCFADFIQKFNPKSVLEIGGGHGILATHVKSAQWYNVDPLGKENANAETIVIREFFNKDFNPHFKYDAIVHSHTIEHMYNIDEFVETLSNKLQVDQCVIFSMPNLMEMFKKGYTNSLTLEHTVVIEEDVLEHVFNKFKFKLEAKKYFKGAHSIFYCFKRVECRVKNTSPSKRFLKNKHIVNTFIDTNTKICESLNKKIIDKNSVYIFGAHVFTQFLINFGLDPQKINYILDNDADKINKRLYGTNLYVQSPDVISSIQKPTVILYAGNYTQEIKQQLIKINSNTTILSYED